MKNFPLLLVALLTTTAPLAAAPAQATAPPVAANQSANADARAIALLDQSIAAYRGLKSFSQNFVISTVAGGKKRADISGSFSFAPPYLMRSQYVRGDFERLAVSDGKTLITRSGLKEFVQEKSQGSPVREGFLAMPSMMSPYVSLLLEGINVLKSGDEYSSVTYSSRPQFERITFVTEQFTYALAFDPTTRLLQGMSVEGGAAGAKISETTTFDKPSINVNPATLAFVLPAGATLKQAEIDPERYDPRLIVGAAPFALSGNTLDGKAFSLDSMKGKVVLLDFWAVWCGPCVAALPNLKANYDKYHAQGFDIVGVSFDEDEDVLRQFVAERELPWRQIFEGQGWESGNAKTYGVQAIPFALLIGKDGKIAAVDPGAAELSEAIERELAK